MIVSYNFYYARSGNAGAVLEQRLKASDVRATLGLPRGRTLSRVAGADDLPDVIWRLDFADRGLQDDDMDIRAASPEFEAIRLGMRQLYRRFERPLYKPCGTGAAGNGPTLQLHGVYGGGTHTNDAVEAVLHTVAAVAHIAGGSGVPDFICETGSSGLPLPVQQQLERLQARVEHSLWRIEDDG